MHVFQDICRAADGTAAGSLVAHHVKIAGTREIARVMLEDVFDRNRYKYVSELLSKRMSDVYPLISTVYRERCVSFHGRIPRSDARKF